MSLFACLSLRSAPDGPAHGHGPPALLAIAEQFSPRYECLGEHDVVIDLEGLRPLLGDARAIGRALAQTLTAHGLTARVALAGTYTAARVAARTADRVTVIADGRESQVLARLPLESLDARTIGVTPDVHAAMLRTCATWGLRTLGDVAALPPAALRARLGVSGVALHAAARGQDARPLVPTRAAERFETSLDLEWPIEGLEPLSFVLTRLLEPLAARLERRDRDAVAVDLALRLATKETCRHRLELPAPMRDVRTLRALLLLRVEAEPPGAAIDRVVVVAEPTPARTVQHTLFARAQPAPERVSTLVARLEALLGTGRVGTPVVVDTERPGAFALRAFRIAWPERRPETGGDPRRPGQDAVSALRQYRPPVPVRVAVDAAGVPVRITIDRAGFEGGRVHASAGPWKTSGAWWSADAWNHEEWDVGLATGTVYRLAHQIETGHWCLHAVAD